MDTLLSTELLMSSVAAKIKALKTVLTDEQLKQYNESLAASKEKILQRYPSLSPELRTLVDELFS